MHIGVEALELGAGRATKDDAIDHAVGIVCRKKRGDAVKEGEPLAEVHARDAQTAAEAADRSAPPTSSETSRRLPCRSSCTTLSA